MSAARESSFDDPSSWEAPEGEDGSGRKSALQAIKDYERDVNTALKKVARRTHYEQVTEETPLSALLESESGDLDEWALRGATIRALGNYCSQDGPEPWKVMRLFYAVMLHMGIDPYAQLTVRERALMLGDTHGAQHWRVQQFCVNRLRRAGFHSTLAPGQKGSGAAASASAAQMGNKNRGCKHRWDREGKCRKCGQARKTAVNGNAAPASMNGNGNHF